jgi:5-methylcytosine-specific restriction protein A
MPEEAEKAKKRNPDWTRDELLLALDYYFRHPGEAHDPEKPSVQELTVQIGQVAKALGITGSDSLRNANGVSMKLLNFRAHDPDYQARGKVGLSRGNRLEGEVWEEFTDRREHLRQAVQTILVATHGDGEAVRLSDEDDFEAPEGRLLARLHLRRERNRELVKRKKAAAMRDTGRLSCEVCDFDFLAAYGERGRGFIECHHTVPVSSLGEGGRTSVKDLALVCANCHRMIHAGRPWWSIQEARAAVVKTT